MNKTIKIYIGLLILLFIGAIAIEFSKPKPINWTRTFNEVHTIPYGTFILYNELSNLFPESEVQDIAVSPYEYFDEYYSWEDSTYTTSGNYMLIDDYADVDEVSAQELLDFASHGNTIFMSSNYLPQKFLDTLGIDLENDYAFTGKAQLSLANPAFKNDSITIDRGLSNIYFSKLDSTKTTVLGYQKFNDGVHINFVKINHEFGEVFLHLQPVAFTNYSLLKNNNKKYAEAILSYLPDDTFFYDSRNKKRTELGDSPLRFVLSQPALKWAWIFGLVSLLIFILFNAKRKQRIVKVIKPLENSTIAFTKTIGNLYYETKDHNNLIDKKITYFLESIRRKYYLDTQLLDEKFIKNLALKSGKDLDKTKKTMNLIVHLKAKQMCNEDDLKNLNKTIEDFYNN
ncbi:DUF4350 domain-containing protein [Pontimicrobium sp. SW4]|uniref:DUF4350 domain-containing protein n=1 Tax=Pontimicrobium sp. SW4 TaxID=3153519 RepID=A0AAU7BVY7_9FLAO